MTGQQVVASDQRRVRPAEPAQRRLDLLNLGGTVRPRIPLVPAQVGRCAVDDGELS
ncbi:hypothetical protein ACU4GD_43225 [Cupriavidus basilensis]